MSTPQENSAMVEEARQAVLDHCMCAKFEETSKHFIVIYPDGYALNGVTCSKSVGLRAALQRMLVAMERHWQESFPGGKAPGAK